MSQAVEDTDNLLSADALEFPGGPARVADLAGVGRRVVASLWAAAIAPYVVLALWVPAARALGVFGSVPIPALVALSVVASPLVLLLWPRLASLLPASLDAPREPRSRWLAGLWGAGGLVAVVCLGRIAVYLGDSSLVGYSLLPSDPFVLHHSCLTAYMHGAILSTQPDTNVYDMAFVDRAVDAPLPPTAAHFAPFKLDAYGYPPPFLLLARALLWLTPDYLSQRMLFSAASLILAFLACGATARTLEDEAGRRVWLFAPLFLASPPVLATLQVGNFHLAALALCLLCWVALERQRDGKAGMWLALATLAKTFPGLLGVLLLVQRRWRAAGVTVLAAGIVSALSLALLGPLVWRDYFFYQLPRVQSGEALRFMADSPMNVGFNVSPFGLPFKLAALGFAGWGWEQARALGTLTTLVLLVLAVLAGRNTGGAQHRLTVWLALLMLGSLRSPFAPPFVMVGTSLLLLALVPEVRSWRGTLGMVAAWMAWMLPLPLPEPTMIVASLVRALALYVFLVWVVVRRPRTPLQTSAAVVTA
jgi:hypothetical protein